MFSEPSYLPDTKIDARDTKCGSCLYSPYRLGLRRSVSSVVPGADFDELVMVTCRLALRKVLVCVLIQSERAAGSRFT